MPLNLSVDRVVVDTQAERESADKVPAVLEAVFKKLAVRLAGLPSEQRPLRDRALRSLEIELGSVEELVGQRAVDRLADALFEQLTRRLE